MDILSSFSAGGHRTDPTESTPTVKYHMFWEPGYGSFNEKSHDFVHRHWAHDNQCKIHPKPTFARVRAFIDKHRNRKDQLLVFYSQKRTRLELQTLEYLNSIPSISLPVVFFTFDYWHRGDQPYAGVIHKIFFARNHYVMTFARTLAQIEGLWKWDLSPYRDRILTDCNMWSCYEASRTPFVADPIPKMCVSGVAGASHYWERAAMLKKQGTVRLPYTLDDHYCRRLSRYLCCFASSVHIHSRREGRFVNTHLILLKVFEILSSGSFLLCPDTEIETLKHIGLENNVHYMGRPMSTIHATINWLLNPTNKRIVDKIRREGWLFARHRLNSATKYATIKDKLAKLCE